MASRPSHALLLHCANVLLQRGSSALDICIFARCSFGQLNDFSVSLMKCEMCSKGSMSQGSNSYGALQQAATKRGPGMDPTEFRSQKE